jgi:hypothetical protein
MEVTVRRIAHLVLSGTLLTTAAVCGGALPASAESSTISVQMAPNYFIEASVRKDFGNPSPTYWWSNATAYHGTAYQSMSWIKNATHIHTSAIITSASCSAGAGGANCTVSPNPNTQDVYYNWTNGNTYLSALSGDYYANFFNGIGWAQVCTAASAYSDSLKIGGPTANACVG